MIYEVRDATGVAIAWTTAQELAQIVAEKERGDYIPVGLPPLK